MTAPPPWRRLSPASLGARLAAAAVLVLGAVILTLVVAAPLAARFDAAKDRTAALDRRAAALTAAAAARRAEAAFAAPKAADIARAEAWLDRNAPRRADGEAMLELLSTLRLLARTSGVELVSVAPLSRRQGAAAEGFARAAETAGLAAHIAEARIVADHAGLAALLGALEAVTPTVRASALDVSARNASATAEARRLSVRLVVAALSRPEAAE